MGFVKMLRGVGLEQLLEEITDRSIEELDESGSDPCDVQWQDSDQILSQEKGSVVEELPVGDAWLDILMQCSRKSEQTGYATQEPLNCSLGLFQH